MTRKKEYQLSVRLDEETNSIIEAAKTDNKLKNKSDVVRYLAQNYKNSNSNNNPYYRGQMGWLTMKMESVFNEIERTGDVRVGREVLEEFKCRILS